MTLSQLCKSYGFKGTSDVARRYGCTERTLQNKFNNKQRREVELMPMLERLTKSKEG